MIAPGSPTVAGSPPRVREKPLAIVGILEVCGITPACAGKTTSKLSVLQLEKGSPPRVREKRRDERDSIRETRITPACAGKTLKDPNEIKTFLSF